MAGRAGERPRNIVVAGAGVVGVCLAARLAEMRAGVTLLEQGQPGRGATWSSFAWLNANAKLPRAYHDLNHAGMRAWAELAARMDRGTSAGAQPAARIDGGTPAGAQPAARIDGGTPAGAQPAARMDGGGWYRPVGNIEWSADPAGHEELAARVRRLAGWGYPASLIGAAQAAELEPSLRPRGLPAAVAWFPEEGYLVTEDLIADMVQRAVHDGVTMLTGEPGRVTGFDVAAGAVQAVRTAAGASIPADAVVLCAGRSVPGLAALAGAAGPIPLVRWAGPGAAAPGLVVRAGPVAPPGLTRVVHAPGVYLRPHPGGLVHIEAPDAAVDLHTPRADLRWWADELLARARRAVPGLDQAEVTAYRVCVRPMPADGQSVLGWLPGIRGLYVAVTHSGVTLAAHLAQLVATELLTATVTGLGPYRPGRFAPATA